MQNSNNVALAQKAYDNVPEPNDHDNFIENGVCANLTYVAPHKALAKQKRWMRQFCRKPANMSVRKYTNSLRWIKKQELHWLPPFAPDQLFFKATNLLTESSMEFLKVFQARNRSCQWDTPSLN
jgi:hypothetical protein